MTTTQKSTRHCPICNSPLNEYGGGKKCSLKKSPNGEFVRRRYFKCAKNHEHLFKFDERILPGSGFYVKKKSGNLESFDINKLIKSIISVSTPSFSQTQSTRLAERIGKQLGQRANRGMPIPTQEIGDEVLKEFKLRGLEAMWVRYFVAFKKQEIGFDFQKAITIILQEY